MDHDALIAALRADYDVPAGFSAFKWRHYTWDTQHLYEAMHTEPWWSSNIEVRLEIVAHTWKTCTDYTVYSRAFEGEDFVIEWWLVKWFTGPRPKKDVLSPVWFLAPITLLRYAGKVFSNVDTLVLTRFITAGEVELVLEFLDGRKIHSTLFISDTTKLFARPIRDVIRIMRAVPWILPHISDAYMDDVYALSLRHLPEPAETRRRIRQVFALMIGISDAYLQMAPATIECVIGDDYRPQFVVPSAPIVRFFNLATQLPIELQWHLACAVVGTIMPQRELLAGDTLWMLNVRIFFECLKGS
jgi:hypothetical protein